MGDILIEIEDTVARALQNIPKVDASTIRDTVEKFSVPLCQIHNDGKELTDSDKSLIVKKLQERFDITMTLGTLFHADEYRPWLDECRGNIEWYYWGRYKRFLGQERYPPQVIQSLESITDQILDHLENPEKEGGWARKGLVVGYVQSGKTSNYIGLVCKAADSGYKVIIVLAGTLNSLRNQTQERMDKGFIGRCTRSKVGFGVGIFDSKRIPAYFTTSVEDFRKNIANQIGVGIGDLKEPVLLVIKKNVKTLENLTSWLKDNNPHKLKDYPTLTIDDEADHASINTNKEGESATAINSGIRKLIHLFDRSSYVGYTATPFANIFIDPETDNEMLGDDLFPRDFIISLDPPSNYVGPARVFSDTKDLDIVREIDDFEDLIPLNHKITWRPPQLPDSLKEAICIFVLIRAMRILRGQNNKHNSMMINVSRFTNVQSNVKLLIDDYIKEVLRPSIFNHYKLYEKAALLNSEMSKLYSIWDKEYSNSGHSWQDVQGQLKEAISPVSVIEVNSSSAAEPLDYSEQNYPNGRNVIAVGGLGLSRGLTLEGLTVSYFLRNSLMYDTLMQMGRWFGYRDGYDSLCRIFMPSEAFYWYQHISDVIEELRDEFKRMKAASMTPKDFGLCVRSHPESLIVTARNKMRTGTPVIREISLEGRLVETAQLLNKESVIENNLNTLQLMLKNAEIHGKKSSMSSGYLWQAIPANYVLQFIDNFQNHPASQLTEPKPLSDYIGWISSQGMGLWDIVLVSLSKNIDKTVEKEIESLKVITQKRTVTLGPGNSVLLNKHRVASRGLEKVGLTLQQIEEAETEYNNRINQDQNNENKAIKTNIPDHVYREKRERPLLMLHILDCRIKNGGALFKGGIAAYGISFPGKTGNHKSGKLVKYIVNTTWWKNNYLDLTEDEEGGEDE
jgi:hypothetical protein